MVILSEAQESVQTADYRLQTTDGRKRILLRFAPQYDKSDGRLQIADGRKRILRRFAPQYDKSDGRGQKNKRHSERSEESWKIKKRFFADAHQNDKVSEGIFKPQH